MADEPGYGDAVALLQCAHRGDKDQWNAIWDPIGPDRRPATVWQLCLLADAWLEFAAREGDLDVEAALQEMALLVTD